MLHTVKIENHHNLFAVFQTLETWSQKVIAYQLTDQNNRVLAASHEVIQGLKKEFATFFPAWRFGFRYSLKGRVFAQGLRELYIAFDDNKTIQGIAVTDKEMSQDGKIYYRKLHALVTCPDNLSSSPTKNKVIHVGKALLFHIVSMMEKEKTSIPLRLEYMDPAKGFYEKMGFLCIPYTDTGTIPGGRASLPQVQHQKFLQLKIASTMELDEPEFLVSGSADKQKFETTLLEQGKQSILDSFKKGQFRAYCKITQEEVEKLQPRMASLFCFMYSDLFSPSEKEKLFFRLSYIPDKEKPVPEIEKLAPLSIANFIKSQKERIWRIVKEMMKRKG